MPQWEKVSPPRWAAANEVGNSIISTNEPEKPEQEEITPAWECGTCGCDLLRFDSTSAVCINCGAQHYYQ